MFRLRGVERNYLLGAGLLSGLCLALFGLRVLITGSSRYYFIPINLTLAWLALIFGWLLVLQLKRTGWLNWKALVLGILWLIFLPNCWYVLTDFLHVGANGEISQLYDITLMTTLVVSGFLLGFTSLYLVHRELRQELSARLSNWLVAFIILLASFGIYLGRDLRWNTWDVLKNPGGVLINISDRVAEPLGHPRAINITGLFFVLIGILYLVIWLFLGPSAYRHRRR